MAILIRFLRIVNDEPFILGVCLISIFISCNTSNEEDKIPSNGNEQYTIKSKDGNISVNTEFEISEDISIETYYDSCLIFFSIEPSIELNSQAQVGVKLSTLKQYMIEYPARLFIHHFTEDSIYFQEKIINQTDDIIQFSTSSFSYFTVLLGEIGKVYNDIDEVTTEVIQRLIDSQQDRVIAGNITPLDCIIGNLVIDAAVILASPRPKNSELIARWHSNLGLDITGQVSFDYIRKEIIQKTIDDSLAKYYDFECKLYKGIINHTEIPALDNYLTMISYFTLNVYGLYRIQSCSEGKSILDVKVNVNAWDNTNFNQGPDQGFVFYGLSWKDDYILALQKECLVGTDFKIETPYYEYNTTIEVDCEKCPDQYQHNFKLEGLGGGRITYSYSDGSIKRITYNLDASFDLNAINPRERLDNEDWIEYDVEVKNGELTFSGVALDSLDPGNWDEYNFDRGVLLSNFSGSLLLYSISEGKVFYVGFPLHVLERQNQPTPYGIDFFGESDSLVAKIQMPGKWSGFFGDNYPVPGTITIIE